MVEVLPPLREDLELFPSPPMADGSPAWSLHDPAVNKFYLLEWPVFEVVARWEQGSIGSIIENVTRETTLRVTEEDVKRVIVFLERNSLLQPITAEDTQRLIASKKAAHPGWALWLLKNYLFIRIPLVNPQSFLRAVTPLVGFIYSRPFFVTLMFLFVTALVLIFRQWDVFLHSFVAYTTLEGMLIAGTAVLFSKIIHELGHAFTAFRYGCRIPTMGVALVVMFPMLYTDTNEAWKLKSRSERLAIGVAGMTAELILALGATWAWILLTEGPLRAAAFILATTTWIMTLGLNASPFMRFDGYFILSDFLRLPNLHQRSFAFGKHWIREFLFGLKAPPVEPASKRLALFMVIFAFATWLYRFVVFIGIALLVYHFFFKALGVFLFVVELAWFIVLPVFKEIKAWWELREKMKWNLKTMRSSVILLALILVFVIPWKNNISAPASLSAVREQSLSAPFAAMVAKEFVSSGQEIKQGEVLLQMESADMQQQVQMARTETETSQWQVSRQTFDENLLKEGQVTYQRFEGDSVKLAGLEDVMSQLTLKAPFDGVIVSRNDEILPGAWFARKELLYVIADTSKSKLIAYVQEDAIDGVKVGSAAQFIPGALEFGQFDCRVADIDQVNTQAIDEPFLTTVYGGALAARETEDGALTPNTSLFRIHIDRCLPSNVLPVKVGGIVHIEKERKSLIAGIFTSIHALLIRELGL